MTIELPDIKIGSEPLTSEQARIEIAVGLYAGQRGTINSETVEGPCIGANIAKGVEAPIRSVDSLGKNAPDSAARTIGAATALPRRSPRSAGEAAVLKLQAYFWSRLGREPSVASSVIRPRFPCMCAWRARPSRPSRAVGCAS